VDYFLRIGEKLAELGVQIICLKDMGGLLSPYVTYDLVKGLKSRIPLPLHLHSHCTAGLAPMSYMMAIDAGVDIVDTALAPLSQGTSQPATEQIVAALKGTPRDTGLDLNSLNDIADYFYGVRLKYAEFESPVNNQIKTDVLVSQIPGGMLSNLVAQLRQQKAEDRLDAVLAEMPHVRKDLGYPPLVTPTSQIIGSQAALNVMTGSVIPSWLWRREITSWGFTVSRPDPLARRLRRKYSARKKPSAAVPPICSRPAWRRRARKSAALPIARKMCFPTRCFRRSPESIFSGAMGGRKENSNKQKTPAWSKGGRQQFESLNRSNGLNF